MERLDRLNYMNYESQNNIFLAGTPAAGELVQFRVYRDAGDTLAADAGDVAVKVYYGI